jgi:hypothetical protein
MFFFCQGVTAVLGKFERAAVFVNGAADVVGDAVFDERFDL